jgi:hypothetical protein
MRCYICDSQDDNISWDPKDGRYRSCFVCQGIITDCVATEPDDEDSQFLIDEEFDDGA